MSVYGELEEHRTQFGFKGKKGHIAKVNMPNIVYPNEHIDIEIPHDSRDHVIVPDTIKVTFNLDIESTDKAQSIVNNADRTLVKKKVLMCGLKEIDKINNSNVFDTYKDFYLSAKKGEKSYFKGYNELMV